MDVKYKLIAEEIPPISKATVYEKILNEFAAGRNKTVRVEIPSKKPATVHQGLLKARRVNGKFGSISVVRRGEAIYLKK